MRRWEAERHFVVFICTMTALVDTRLATSCGLFGERATATTTRESTHSGAKQRHRFRFNFLAHRNLNAKNFLKRMRAQ